MSPSQLISLSFAAAIAAGTLLLALPAAHAPGQHVTLLDALFTATSAICVTGLAVVDTSEAWSAFGRVAIMLLIQSGGLGIITLGTLLAFVSGRRLGFRERVNLQAQVNALQVGGVVRLIRHIVLLAFGLELLGALLLYLRFGPLETAGPGAFYALFHSISAFNNAGFSLYPNNLMRFATDPFVNLTVMLLIVLGGLGFPTLLNVATHLRRRRAPLTLQTKITLMMTAVLLVAGTTFVCALEWANPGTLGPLSWPAKLLAGLFQAVTPRTAGFNTLEYGAMHEATLVFTMLLMFIGGSSGSSAGGIKTVTFFVLAGSAWSLSRGRGELSIYGRRIALDTVLRASVIALISLMMLGGAITLLTITDSEYSLLPLAFEAFSAFATTGLSTGITPELSVLGKLILIALMYLGRLGPLTFALALIERAPEKRIKYPAEDVVIG
ncbi:MAG TPA: TrkH family potassium uptake protein [Trueperaceae bacterium]